MVEGDLAESNVVTFLLTHLQFYVVGGLGADCKGGLFRETSVPRQAGPLGSWGDHRLGNRAQVNAFSRHKD